jgi:AbrB family looped-hinge helix DNA binding protein
MATKTSKASAKRKAKGNAFEAIQSAARGLRRVGAISKAMMRDYDDLCIAPIPRSQLTSQGQISVPAEIRRKLGLAPGSVIEWAIERGQVIVRPAGRFTSADVHSAIFPAGLPPKVPIEDMKASIAKHVRRRHRRVRY